MILGSGKRSLMSKLSWEEKPSILGLMDKLMDKLNKNMETAQVHLADSRDPRSLPVGFMCSWMIRFRGRMEDRLLDPGTRRMCGI